MSRKFTPDQTLPSGGKRVTVKRCCNGCGREIGVATAAELNAAISRVTLPDVREECGCWSPVEEHTPEQQLLVDAFGIDHDSSVPF
jgi:hypothetical protein